MGKNWLLFSLLCLVLSKVQAKTLIDQESELRKVLSNYRLSSSIEDFYLLEDGTLLYHTLDNDEMLSGLWFTRHATFNYGSPSPYEDFEPTAKERIGQPVVCIAVGVTSTAEFNWVPCIRLYKQESGAFIGHQTQCNFAEPLANDVLHCNWTARVFFQYRIRPIEP
ncbi:MULTISPECIES: hypothetical protein [unclassified Pseudoalteromonas]|uniref:hypothetical protein n=1 Tax=unclassified Pseudoalteromonas TaxID=194690 RepID=UPI0030154AD3